MPENMLTFRKCAEKLGIELRSLENYAMHGRELEYEKINRIRYIHESELERWHNQRQSSLIQLTRDEYLRCAKFAIRSYYWSSARADFATSRQRDAGQIYTNYVFGKLGEMALQKFLLQHFQLNVRLDFEFRNGVVGQDIIEIAIPRRTPRVYNPPAIRVAIKTTKMKNVWLIVGQKEIEDSSRLSDAYVLVRIDLPQDHLFRLLRNEPSFSSLTKSIPEFENIGAEIVGFAWHGNLSEIGLTNRIPDLNFAIQPSYIMRSGDLHRSQDAWRQFCNRLCGGLT